MLRAGIDDCGSGPFRGFSCLICSDRGAKELERAGQMLLSAADIDSFHGRLFNSGCEKEVQAYEDFARAIRETLENHGEYAAFQLLHRDTYEAIFSEFAERVVDGALTEFREKAPKFATAKAGALFSLARCLGELRHREDLVAVELDQDQDEDERAGAAIVGLATEQGALLTTASDALVRVANAYKSQVFPDGPSIRSLRAGPSASSILVQAADLLANFGVASLKSRLRDGSESGERERVRAQIFESIAGDAVLTETGSLRVTEHNELSGSADDNPRFELRSFPE